MITLIDNFIHTRKDTCYLTSIKFDSITGGTLVEKNVIIIYVYSVKLLKRIFLMLNC